MGVADGFLVVPSGSWWLGVVRGHLGGGCGGGDELGKMSRREERAGEQSQAHK